MSRLLRSVAMLAIGLAGARCGSTSPPVEVNPPEVRLAVGSRGGDFWNFGNELARAVEGQHSGYKVTIIRAVGRQTLQALQDGTADCGFAFANLAYEAFSGRLDPSHAPFDHLRGLATIEVTPLNVLVPVGSPVRGIRDLRGRRVLIGTPDSGSYRAARIVFDAYELSDEEGGVEIIAEGFGRVRPYLLGGQADAVLILARGPFGFDDSGLRPVPIDDVTVDALRRLHPFFRVVLVPSGSFQEHKAPLKTVGIESVLLCRDTLSPELVRQLTADWFTALDQLLEAGALSEAFTRRTASATPIPLHQGARDYYRVRQVLLRD